MMKYNIQNFIKTIESSTSPFHTSQLAKERFNDAGFQELNWGDDWKLTRGGKYYVAPFDATLIVFKINSDFCDSDSIKMVTSHIDNPGLRIKASPEHFQGNYMKVNAEVYGGAILNTWFDRPLSAAGRVFIKSPNSNKPIMKLIDFKRPILVIPNISIHMNRKVNDGIALNPQIDIIPFAGISTDHTTDSHFLTAAIADMLNVTNEDIISFELCVYNCEEPKVAGLNEDMLIAPRIDNISSVEACINGLINADNNSGIDIAVLFDHEEVGSKSKNGAFGNLVPSVIERIYCNLGVNRENYLKALLSGQFLSLDVAHATNPNHPEKYDITTPIEINQGVALKTTGKQNYCGDSEMNASLLLLAKDNNIPLIVNYLRNDVPGGSTLGSILSAFVPMKCADLGIPILAMHSAMETMGISDQYYLEKLVTAFLN